MVLGVETRTVTLVGRTQLPLPAEAVDAGGIYARAMVLGDVDDDGCNELVYGMPNGTLYIFKDRHLLCTWIDPLHGRIACVAVGNAANNGRTIVAVLMAEGRCELLALAQGSTDGAAPLRLERVGTVHISVNAKSACIADADGDGLQELVVGRTDRVIEVYRVHTAGTDPVRGETIPAEGVTVELVYTTSLPAQVGSVLVAATREADKTGPAIFASQPGGDLQRLQIADGASREPTPIQLATTITTEKDLSHSDASCVVVPAAHGNLGVCATDGTVWLYDPQTNQTLWQSQIYRTLFAGGPWPTSAAAAKDSSPVLVVCSWDGSTFFFDHEGHVVQFMLQEEVASFAVGRYGKDKAPALVYAVMGGGIHIYENAQLPAIAFPNFRQCRGEVAHHLGRNELPSSTLSELLYAAPPAETADDAF